MGRYILCAWLAFIAIRMILQLVMLDYWPWFEAIENFVLALFGLWLADRKGVIQLDPMNRRCEPPR